MRHANRSLLSVFIKKQQVGLGTCSGFCRVYTSVRTSLIEENHLSGRDQTLQEHAEPVQSFWQILFWICKRIPLIPGSSLA